MSNAERRSHRGQQQDTETAATATLSFSSEERDTKVDLKPASTAATQAWKWRQSVRAGIKQKGARC